MKRYDHLSTVAELPDKIATKKVRPKQTAWVDEDNCTGCTACVPFCPVDCIEPVALGKHVFPPIPPVQIRFNECIGCQICARVCTKLTWDAIRMIDTDELENKLDITIN
tara:strand:+ start:402 stop:728 length:327 start_codon:yes stop_codon:yes gene_type:complete